MALDLNDVATIIGLVLGSAGLVLSIWTHFVDYRQQYVPRLHVRAKHGMIGIPGGGAQQVINVTATNRRAAPVKLSGFTLEIRGWDKELFLSTPAVPTAALPCKVEQGDVVEWPCKYADIVRELSENDVALPKRVRVRAGTAAGDQFESNWLTLTA